jgi:hypothetical protein
MINQLEDSIKWDCERSYHKDELMKLEAAGPSFGKDWKQEKIDNIKGSIEYQEKSYKEDKERCEERSKWITDLMGSL